MERGLAPPSSGVPPSSAESSDIERAIGLPPSGGIALLSAAAGDASRSRGGTSPSARLRSGCAPTCGEMPSRYSAAFSASPPASAHGGRVRVRVGVKGRAEGAGCGVGRAHRRPPSAACPRRPARSPPGWSTRASWGVRRGNRYAAQTRPARSLASPARRLTAPLAPSAPQKARRQRPPVPASSAERRRMGRWDGPPPRPRPPFVSSPRAPLELLAQRAYPGVPVWKAGPWRARSCARAAAYSGTTPAPAAATR